ncbi:MAG: response regulator [Phycisphaerae bacterium]|nr:response regulator [Phycisphaerae bacterium]
MKRDGPIRLLIVDGSPAFRVQLRSRLRAHNDLEVLATASDTRLARERVLAGHPDIIVLDLDLVRGDSLPFLQKLRAFYPVPVFGVSHEAGRNAMQAVELGALEVLQRPAGGDTRTLDRFADDLAERARIAFAQARPVPLLVGPSPARSWREAGLNPDHYLVVIGASTGGTEAIRELLAAAPPDFPATTIVQHMPAAFTDKFAERLDQSCDLMVSEGVAGQPVKTGQVVVARGDTHMEVRRRASGWHVVYTHQQPVNNHCPSVDVLFESAAKHAGPAAIGLLLTGMGADGARGLLAMHQRGCLTLAQTRASCVVYGMPKAAVELGAVAEQRTPEGLPNCVLQQVQRCAVR